MLDIEKILTYYSNIIRGHVRVSFIKRILLMASWEGKTRGGKTGYGIFIFLLNHFNISIAYFVLRFVAFYFVFFSPTSFKALFYFYNKQIRFNFVKSILFIYNNYYKFGQILLDKVALLSGIDIKFSCDFTEEIYLNEIIEENNGGILIGAHVGNWEISAQLLNRFKSKFNIVLADAEHEKIKELLAKTEINKRLNMILIKEDLSHIYQINEVLLNKEFICIHGDRYIENSKTIKHNFINGPARYPYGVFYLAIRYHTPVSFVFGIKTDNNHYKFFATKPKYYDTSTNKKTNDEALRIVLDEYIINLEKMVKRYPEQWFNYFHFWDSFK
jgi:predicted LPLAT superfamily acyltransferase